jgi:hypothetical protein
MGQKIPPRADDEAMLKCDCGGAVELTDATELASGGFQENYRCTTCHRTGTLVETSDGREKRRGCLA